VDVTVPGAAPDAVDALRCRWDMQVGKAIPIPPAKPVGEGDYRITIRHSKVQDAVIEDLYSGSVVGGTGGDFNHLNDRVVMHVVQQGEWRFARPGDRGNVAVPVNQFIVRYNDPPWQFEVEPRTAAKVFILTASELRPLIGDRPVMGPSDSAEVRLLMAHVGMVDATLNDLTPAGVLAARNSIVELVKGVLTRGIDAAEPRFAPALAQVAKDVVESRLADPDLSPPALARELHVSIRTLHRAFAVTEESVTAYIRRRRLEQARLELTAPAGRPSISELAARWRFADSSHFVRAFKRQYGETPTEFARLRSYGPTPSEMVTEAAEPYAAIRPGPPTMSPTGSQPRRFGWG
jgi:AraC family transcriptional activator of tynA and feaB